MNMDRMRVLNRAGLVAKTSVKPSSKKVSSFDRPEKGDTQ
jgi:hypothetical protein